MSQQLSPKNQPKQATRRTRTSRTKLFLKRFASLATAALFVFAAEAGQAQTVYSWNATSDFWDVGSAWNPGGPPGANDIARFGSNITDTVVWDSITGNRTTGSLEILAGNYDFNNNETTQYTLTLGSTTNDALTVQGGGTSFTLRGLHLNALTRPIYVDGGANMTLNGAAPAGTQMTSGNSIDVGYSQSGSSTVNINSGADLTTAGGNLGFLSGSTGTINVTGLGSTWANSSFLRLGVNSGSTGNLIVNGGAVTAGTINIGESGAGNVLLNNSGRIKSSGLTTIGAGGRLDVDTGFLLVTTNALNSSGFLTNGLTVNGGTVDATVGTYIGQSGQSGTLTLTNNATFSSSNFLSVGDGGTAQVNVQSGSDVTSSVSVSVGFFGSGTATVTGSGSTWNNNGAMFIGGGGTGQLTVASGGLMKNTGLTTIGAGGRLDVDTGFLQVTTNSPDTSGFLTNGLTVNGGIVDATVGTFIGRVGQSGTLTMTNNATFSGSSFLNVGAGGTGQLNVESGSDVTSAVNAFVGFQSGSNGTVTVTGSGSTWNNNAAMFIGGGGTGQLTVASNGLVRNTGLTTIDAGGRLDVDTGFLLVTTNALNSSGFLTNGLTVNGGTVDATVGTAIGLFGQSGTLSLTNNATFSGSNFLSVGDGGTGQLNVQSGSDVTSAVNVWVGFFGSSNGTATVTGSGSTWNNNGAMFIGGSGTGQLTVASGGLMKNTGLTTIGAGGRLDVDTGYLLVTTNSPPNSSGFLTNGLTVNGGTVDATVGTYIGQSGQSGTMTLTNNAVFSNPFLFIGEGGTGVLNVQSGSDVITAQEAFVGFLGGGNGTATVTGTGSSWNITQFISIGNFGGTGTLNVNSSGQVNVGGNTNINGTGTVNLGGGVLATGSLTNQIGGNIAGHGTLTASGGIQNSGTMNFNGGATTVNGTVTNGSLIITAAASTTTFNNNVIHNGTEIRTLATGSTVFKGNVSGNGNYTQAGAVTFEKNFKPGTGPRIVTFGGNVTFTSTAQSFFEIGGLNAGVNGYDQLQIAGNLFLGNSTLNVELYKDFLPNIKSKFLIASVAGTVNGQFAGLSEGAQIGKTGLFITYLGFGSGNGIGLFTSDKPRLLSEARSGYGNDQSLSAVPEPCSLVLVGMTLLFVPAISRRKA